MKRPPGLGARVAAGAVAGAAVAGVDHVVLGGGQVSSVVVVGLLLSLTAGMGSAWTWRGWVAAATTWACLQLVHVTKHLLGLPGTLQPDTWTSIGTMAAFTGAVCLAGFLGGAVIRAAAAD